MKFSINFVLIRIITAVALFAALGKANEWMDTTTNTLLALGYSIELIFLPITLLLLGSRALIWALAVMAAGAALFIITDKPFVPMVAACLFAYGAAVSGYLITNVAAQSKHGAARNLMSVNAGALVGGVIIMFPFLTPVLFFWSASGIVLICLLIALPYPIHIPEIHTKVFDGQKLSTVLAWVLIGITMGMIIFGTFSVLPQNLLETHATLPSWYGFMIILNCFVIVVAQMPILKFIETAGRYRMPAIFGLIFMTFGLYILMDFIPIYSFLGAAVWMILVSLGECTLGHLDYYSTRQKVLFVKEISIGFGSGLTVLLMRTLPDAYNSTLIAVLGISFTLIWWALTHRQLRHYD
ncbi:MFS transporter [Flexibacterium corallicola]|uniref:hypothetical protein n=1 Tax=Flexibacterium corallicola TaxID=3037259 RepID=UPI00286F4A91|nr:hypothetical protein [Pseudovibrio sp. M1P-2-3]